MTQIDFSHNLQELMQRVNISSFKSLSRVSGVSERQILRLRQGKIIQMRLDILLKLSKVLQVSVSELIVIFLSPGVLSDIVFSQDSELSSELEKLLVSASVKPQINSNTQSLELLQKEYQQILLTMSQQRESLWQEFQHSSLDLLESLLLQWPTAAQRAQENPQLAAIKIVPLVQKSLEKLLQAWGITAIAPVGIEVAYNPQLHQLAKGDAQLGEAVKVYYTGYLQGDKLLYRAQVIPIEEGVESKKIQ